MSATKTILVGPFDHRYCAIERAIQVYGDCLQCSAQPVTLTTLQGETATGYCVYGRSHGGDLLGCLFSTRQEANAYIEIASGPQIGADGVKVKNDERAYSDTTGTTR